MRQSSWALLRYWPREPGSRAQRFFCLVAALMELTVFSLPVTADAIGAQLAAPYPREAAALLQQQISLWCSGAALKDPRLSAPVADFNHAADRLYYAAELFHAGKAPAISW